MTTHDPLWKYGYVTGCILVTCIVVFIIVTSIIIPLITVCYVFDMGIYANTRSDDDVPTKTKDMGIIADDDFDF